MRCVSGGLPLFDSPREILLTIIKSRTGSNPVSIAVLRQRTGFSDRAIKGIVSHARKEGLPICSRKEQPAGYWYASTEAEITETTERLKREAKDIFWTIGRMRNSEEMFSMLGQLRIELERDLTTETTENHRRELNG